MNDAQLRAYNELKADRQLLADAAAALRWTARGQGLTGPVSAVELGSVASLLDALALHLREAPRGVREQAVQSARRLVELA